MTNPYARAIATRWLAASMRLNRRTALVTATELDAFERLAPSPRRAGSASGPSPDRFTKGDLR